MMTLPPPTHQAMFPQGDVLRPEGAHCFERHFLQNKLLAVDLDQRNVPCAYVCAVGSAGIGGRGKGAGIGGRGKAGY